MKIKSVTRKDDIDTLIEIIKNNEEYKENSKNGLVILLNGEWGTGKTTFLEEFTDKLQEIDNIELFNNYNAYENDYYDNAYIPFFASIEDKIQLKEEFHNFIKSVGGNTIKGLVVWAYAISKSIFKRKFDIDSDDIKNNLKDMQEEAFNNDYLKDYNNLKKYKIKIKEKMNKLCAKKIQVFIIDELDRCKPSFAMETLEIVKHFFDISNCVFIISVDKVQLQGIAKNIYGNEINSEKYFSKLFDYQFNLLPINFYDAIDCSSISNMQELIVQATNVFNILNISLRDSKKIFNELIKKNKSWTIYQSTFMLFLFVLKYTDLSFYKAIINGDYSKYRKLFETQYNGELEKYNKLLNYKIGNDLLYGEILEELNLCINKDYTSLGNNKNNSFVFLRNKSRSINEIEKDIKKYVPEFALGLTVKENIKRIIA